jgi:hypothetical protein
MSQLLAVRSGLGQATVNSARKVGRTASLVPAYNRDGRQGYPFCGGRVGVGLVVCVIAAPPATRGPG